MTRWMYALLGLTFLVLPALGQADKLTVKDIMKRVNKGPDALFPTVRKELNAASPNWGELQKQAKEIATLTESLMKKDPPRGEKAAWMQFTKDYAGDTKALADAAQKKDKDGMIGAHLKITKACTACHNAHRPQ